MIKNDFGKTNKNIILDFLLLLRWGTHKASRESGELAKSRSFPQYSTPMEHERSKRHETNFCSCPLKGDVKEDKFT
jgi:hypothetical protein